MVDSENRTLSDKFMLRLPDGMRERIKEAARQNGRSMNAEIVAALEEKYPLPTIDLQALTLLLESIFNASGEQESEYIDHINNVLSSTDTAYQVEAKPDGRVVFYPTLKDLPFKVNKPEDR